MTDYGFLITTASCLVVPTIGLIGAMVEWRLGRLSATNGRLYVLAGLSCLVLWLLLLFRWLRLL